MVTARVAATDATDTQTSPPTHGRRPAFAGSLRRILVAAVALVSISILSTSAATTAADPSPLTGWQSISSIEQAALSHVEQIQSGHDGRIESRVSALDKRLKLARCGKALETYTPSTARPGATQIVGVRCNAPKPWKIYVPINTAVYRSVVVANRPLRKGTSVNPDDVRLEERDVTRVQQRYLTDLAQLEGHILKQDVLDQAIIDQNVLGEEDIVQRGQNITLLARRGSLNVRMRGEALASAAKNERVRVKNLSSQRIVEGIVQSRQIVLIEH